MAVAAGARYHGPPPMTAVADRSEPPAVAGAPRASGPARSLKRYSIVQGDRDMLLGCLLVIVLAATLSVADAGQGVSVPVGGDGGLRLPPLCPTKVVLDIDCPGCGLTRSFVATAHGELRAAWGFHRFGPIFFAIVALQVPYRGARLVMWWRRRRRGEAHAPPPAGLGTAVFVVIGVGLAVNWVWSIIADWVGFLGAARG